MKKIRVMVSSGGKVLCGGVASILKAAKGLEIVGNEGNEILEEAFNLQPDLLIYQMYSPYNAEYERLKKLKETCNWTKIVIYSDYPLKKDYLKKLLGLCDGYLQGPVLPGLFLKAVELACYSGHFFFLGSSNILKFEEVGKVEHVLVNLNTIN